MLVNTITVWVEMLSSLPVTGPIHPTLPYIPEGSMIVTGFKQIGIGIYNAL